MLGGWLADWLAGLRARGWLIMFDVYLPVNCIPYIFRHSRLIGEYVANVNSPTLCPPCVVAPLCPDLKVFNLSNGGSARRLCDSSRELWAGNDALSLGRICTKRVSITLEQV